MYGSVRGMRHEPHPTRYAGNFNRYYQQKMDNNLTVQPLTYRISRPYILCLVDTEF